MASNVLGTLIYILGTPELPSEGKGRQVENRYTSLILLAKITLIQIHNYRVVKTADSKRIRLYMCIMCVNSKRWSGRRSIPQHNVIC